MHRRGAKGLTQLRAEEEGGGGGAPEEDFCLYEVERPDSRTRVLAGVTGPARAALDRLQKRRDRLRRELESVEAAMEDVSKAEATESSKTGGRQVNLGASGSLVDPVPQYWEDYGSAGRCEGSGGGMDRLRRREACGAKQAGRRRQSKGELWRALEGMGR